MIPSTEPGFPSSCKPWMVTAMSDLADHAKALRALLPPATWQDAPEVPKWSAEAAIARVRELHHSKLDRHPQGDVQRCIACLDLWPCPTIRAIDGGAE